ncbi:MAG: glycosyltransferase family 4 protein [Candidatus Omnitrophica bacterium]|nr:glycosyltransferase family 4 protein [Candidatus Omnitrophota bacterium]
MKILAIANGIIGHRPGLSGGEVRFLEIAKRWQKNGQEIELLSSESAGQICQDFGLSVKLHIIPGTKSSNRFSYILRTLQAIFYFPQSLRDFKGDFIYSINDSLFDVIPAMRLKARCRSRVKWVALVHWIVPSPPWKRRYSGILNSILFFINERISLWLIKSSADLVLCVSEATAASARAFGIDPKKVHAVKCGVDLAVAQSAARDVKEKKYDAIYLARLHEHKGSADLSQIWMAVAGSRKDALLLVAGGDREDEEAVRAVFDKLGLEKNVEFCGYIFDVKEKFRKLAESRLLLVPSYSENWGITIGEAMACQTPVVAYDAQGLTDIWRDNVSWVPLGDRRAFAVKVLERLNDHGFLKHMSSKGADFIRQLDWQTIAEEELKLITAAPEERRRA